jgi:hypothetical protein
MRLPLGDRLCGRAGSALPACRSRGGGAGRISPRSCSFAQDRGLPPCLALRQAGRRLCTALAMHPVEQDTGGDTDRAGEDSQP